METHDHGELENGLEDEVDAERRKVLKAVGKYAGFAGASIVLLTAEQALAKQACSTHPMPDPPKNCEP